MRVKFLVYTATISLLQLGIFALAYGEQGGVLACGPLENHYGPFDYRNTSVKEREIVEKVHFTPRVESLAGGNTTMSAGGDMAYTLHVFPNHHRALMALIKLADKEKTLKPRDMRYSVPCYFDRAERFRPDDATVKSIFGVYLLRSGKPQEAQIKLEEALESAGENANVYYNLGLAFFDMKMYERSLETAHRAYSLGFPLPGLRDKLKKVGKWQDQVVVEPKPETTVEGKTLGTK